MRRPMIFASLVAPGELAEICVHNSTEWDRQPRHFQMWKGTTRCFYAESPIGWGVSITTTSCFCSSPYSGFSNEKPRIKSTALCAFAAAWTIKRLSSCSLEIQF
jgi:hypothetical protein